MNYEVYVISHKREKNIPQIIETLGFEPTFVVGTGEKEIYEKHGAKKVIEGGKLTPSRNKALDEAFKQNKICVQLDDDISKFKKGYLDDMGKRKARDISIRDAIEEVIWHLKNSPFKMGGSQVNTNILNWKPGNNIKHHHFIIATFSVHLPNPLRFDEQFTLKEDYDLTLQHVKEYGGVVRVEYLFPVAKHYTNPGGVVDYRDDKTEQENIKKLVKKWGKNIRPHPTRKNEIVLNFR